MNRKLFLAAALSALAILGVAATGMLTTGAAAADTRTAKFPLREKYPQLDFISLAQATEAHGSAVFVDTRTKSEFEVLHIDGAINMPTAALKQSDIEKLSQEHSSKKIIFYCSGYTCTSSYRSAEKARSFGTENCFVFDAGVMEWAYANPEKSQFFGKLLSSDTIKASLIARSKFDDACLDTAEFMTRATSSGWKLFDIRDREERKAEPLKIPGIISTEMDNVVATLAKDNGIVPKSKILFIDSTGKSVEWLQYHLEKSGRAEYFFLKKGAQQMFLDGYDASGTKK